MAASTSTKIPVVSDAARTDAIEQAAREVIMTARYGFPRGPDDTVLVSNEHLSNLKRALGLI